MNGFDILSKMNEIDRQKRMKCGSQAILLEEANENYPMSREEEMAYYGLTEEEMDILDKFFEDLEKGARESEKLA